MKVERRNVYNTQVPSGWKGPERAENGQVVMGGNRSARDGENMAKKGKVFLSTHSSFWSSRWQIPHRSALAFVLLPFRTSLPLNLPWVFPKNPRSLEVPESEPWHQQFLTMAIFKLKLRRMEVFKHLLAIHLPHSLHSRLSSKQRAGMSKKTAARYQQKKSKTSTEVRITKCAAICAKKSTPSPFPKVCF